MKSKLLLCAGIAVALISTAQAREVVGPPGPVGPIGPGSHVSITPAWSTTDLRTGAALPSGEVTVNQIKVKWQIGNYWSDGLQIYGLLCTPTSLPPPYPVAILNHGLEWTTASGQLVFTAIQASGLTGCTTMAGHGWLTAITTYRGETISELVSETFVRRPIINGEDRRVSPFPPAALYPFSATSEGKLELCLGEVDDVLNLLSAVTALPDANAKQVLMWGHSHGSCITERAIERGAPVKIAVSIDGPTDFTTWSNNNPILAPTVAAQEARSTAYSGNDPATLTGVKFLRIHAEGDTVVTPDQGCELAYKFPNIASYYLNSNVSPPGVFWGAPKECSAFQIPWIHGQLLPDEVKGGQWVSPTFLIYSGLSHTEILVKSWPEFSSFVNAVTKSEGWHASIPAQFSVMEN
jgi:hypothetical protein